jgi:hypothetical protein
MGQKEAGVMLRKRLGWGAFLWLFILLCALGGIGVGLILQPAPHYTPHHVPAAPLTARGMMHMPAIPPPKPFSFPGGKRTLAGNYRFVAMYGTPDEPALGVLGDQNLDNSLARVKQMAKDYQPLSQQPTYPSFEIIATVASSSPTENGDYSREVDPAKIQAWAEAAQRAGVYVVLDIQPGRSDFLTQAKEYEQILKLPNVGLALDPEWRLTADQVPLAQIGSVGIDEVNGVASWLSSLVVDNNLPQKLFVLHQFRLDMLPGREQLNTTHPELAYVIQMDGQGTQAAKDDTWRAITANPPANTEFGWKNFISEDDPILSPAQAMALTPQPWYISYQ